MPSLIRLVSAICDQLLALVPSPADAKRLDDIVDPDHTETPDAALLAGDPPSGLRQPAAAAANRAAS